MTVKRFDPDGIRGPTAGYISGVAPHHGAQMSFMPEDSTKPVPQFVDVTWISFLPGYEAIADAYQKLPLREQWVPETEAAYKLEFKKNPVYTQRVDLTPILTPELIKKIRADRDNTQLYLTIMFNNETVSITAKAQKWR